MPAAPKGPLFAALHRAPPNPMLTLSHRSGAQPLPLGSIVEVSVEKGAPGLETRATLRALPICYPKPLRDWTLSDEPIRIFPESPGAYAVDVEWRDGKGRTGRESLEFTIDRRAGRASQPNRARTAAGRLWVANTWEAQALAKDERDIKRIVQRWVQPGDVVYDLGANVGFYATLFARATGEDGQVYCVEPNPICVYLLRANLLAHDLRHAEILPVAVMHHEGATSFSVNYGNTTLGLSEASGYYPDKTGHEIAVPCFTVDAMAKRFGLLPPDLVKIDVEGVETYVVEGMAETLAKHRPTLLLELHHRECAKGVLDQLEPKAYRFFDPETGAPVAPDRARARDGVFQLIARPSS
ncbi:MAG: FkbM family methyltransferase [Acidobacteriota bacterium]